MLKKLMELITGDDNKTLEPAFFMGVLACIVGFGLEIYSVAYAKPFDFQQYGIGAGMLIGLMGAGKKLGS